MKSDRNSGRVPGAQRRREEKSFLLAFQLDYDWPRSDFALERRLYVSFASYFRLDVMMLFFGLFFAETVGESCRLLRGGSRDIGYGPFGSVEIEIGG